jgi:RNA polymerase sigma-70 factor (ECF subfamily)
MARSDGASTSLTLLRQLCNSTNNGDAWRTFVERYKPQIHRWCRGKGLDPTSAEEVCDCVLCHLTEAMRHFDYNPSRSFRGWLRTIVDHAVCDYWRELHRRPGGRGTGDTAVLEMLAHIPAPPDTVELVQELNASLEGEVQRASAIAASVRERVAPHTWQAFWLTAIEERPAPEVAAQLDMKVTSVYMAKNRVGKLLRKEAAKLSA